MEKYAVVTGSSSGIGKAVCEYFARSGYYVYALSRRCEDGRVSKFGETFIEERHCDVTDEESVRHAFEMIKRIDVLIHVAGMGLAGSCEMLSNEDAHKQFETNYFGVLNVNRVALPIMRNAGGGKIIITASVTAIYAIPFQSHYCSTKSALVSYANALRLELKPYKIKVSVIHPGDVKTSFTQSRRVVEDSSSPYYEQMLRSVSKMAHDEEHGLSVFSVAKLYYKVAQKRNPAPSYTTAFSYKLLVFLSRLFPNRFALYVLSKMYLPK